MIILLLLIIVALIGLTVYLGCSVVDDPICYIPDDDDECSGSENILCTYCWGMIEQRCKCPNIRGRVCQCAEPQRSDKV